MSALKPLAKCSGIHVMFPGDRVMMNGDVATAGLRREKDLARSWRVIECGCNVCRRGRHVAVDQRASNGDGWRHIAVAILKLDGVA